MHFSLTDLFSLFVFFINGICLFVVIRQKQRITLFFSTLLIAEALACILYCSIYLMDHGIVCILTKLVVTGVLSTATGDMGLWDPVPSGRWLKPGFTDSSGHMVFLFHQETFFTNKINMLFSNLSDDRLFDSHRIWNSALKQCVLIQKNK